jgi:SWI/SNF-related matrix-associated actin-dependent regulator of chromatin subfamily A-like protein 1
MYDWATLGIDERGLTIHAPKRDFDFVDRVKDIFPDREWSKSEHKWIIPITDNNVDKFRAFAEELGQSLDGDFDAKVERFTAWRDWLVAHCNGKERVTEWEDPTGALREFQAAAASSMYHFRRCFLADPVGTGKTVTTIAAVASAGAYPALVLCPASVMYKWQEEIERFAGEEAIVFRRGTDKGEALKAKWLILSYDMARRERGLMHDYAPRALICDESHRLAGDTKQTRAVKKLADRIDPEYRYLLSATPMKSRPIELKSQLEIAGLMGWMGGSKHFIDTYVKPRQIITRRGKYWDYSGSHNLDKLHRHLTRAGYIRRKKGDLYGQLPPLEVEVIEVDRTKGYDAVHNQVMERIRTGETPGGVTVLEQLKRQAAHEKLEPLIEWCEDHSLGGGGKTLIFTRHRDIAERAASEIEKKLRVPTFCITGEMDKKVAGAQIADFQMEESGPIMVATIGAFKEGVNLTAADKVVFLEQPWTPAEVKQCIGRTWGRMDNIHGALAVFFIMRDSVDSHVINHVADKEAIVGEATGKSEDDIIAAAIGRLRTQATGGA